MNIHIKLLYPWWSTSTMDQHFHTTFKEQLKLEVPPEHQLFGLEAEIIGRGFIDESLFKILDGTERVAEVHLTWSKKQERLPWPITSIYKNFDEWCEQRMIPDHQSFLGVDANLSEFDSNVIAIGLHEMECSDFEKWIYENTEIEKEIGSELYLELLSCDFSKPKDVIDTMNAWYKKRFLNCNFDLRELYSEFNK